MKKFTLSRVLDGFRSSVSQPPGAAASGTLPGAAKNQEGPEISEPLRPEHFHIAQTVCHGFPYQPTAMAFDPVQRLLAVGTKSGFIRILGRPGVDIHAKHEGESNSIVHLQFIMNEGLLLSATADDTMHVWNFRESKKPEVVQSLKFQRERITCLNLPLQSKWLYVGTDRGNVHVVNIDSFQLSGYIINWNKAIEVSRKTHPGSVICLLDCPVDTTKLLLGFESGQIVLWDLKLKAAEMRFQSTEPLRSLSWHSDGKQFMGSHSDGSITTWNVRVPQKPVSITFPHSRNTKDGKPEPCKSIQKVEWKSSRSGENYVIFSGGLTVKTPSLTVIHGKTTTVLEMEHNVLDFICLCETQWENEVQDPYAIIVLLQQDLVLIDLLTPGYPSFENPYPMDVHESPVTCCSYLADCPGDLIPAFYSVGHKSMKKTGFSDKEWPIDGGSWGTSSLAYAEIIMTGHADGSVKFWDTSSTSLQVLYKLKTSKAFERPKNRKSTESSSADDDPFAIQYIVLCPESRLLAVAGASCQVLVYKFRKQEVTSETMVLEIPIICEVDDGTDYLGGAGGFDFSKVGDTTNKPNLEYFVPVQPKSGPQKKLPGYQIEIVCLMPWINGEPPGAITSLALNSSYGILAYGNDVGLVIVDTVQKICLMSVATPDLYGTADPYQRAPKSPKRPEIAEERSPTDQMDGVCLSPTATRTSSSAANPQTTSPRKSGAAGAGGAVDSAVVRRSKSQGTSRRTEWMKSKQNYSMAGQGGSPEATITNTTPTSSTPHLPSLTSSFPTTSSSSSSSAHPPHNKSHLLLLSRQYYSFGSNNVTSTSNYQPNTEKIDPTFSRSRSSSMSSLDNISSEAIQCLTFVDSYSKKGDFSILPTLWVGTSLGSILLYAISLPSGGKEVRKAEPVNISPSGTIFRMKGPILMMSFLDCNGLLISGAFESWRDESREARSRTPTKGLSGDSDKSSASSGDRQFGVFLSEKQARVVSLPSQTCLYKQQICETSFVIKAEITAVKESSCLVCYSSNGRLRIYSLPSLRPLLDADFVPLSDLSFHQAKKSGIVDPMLSIWGQQIIVNEDTNSIAKTFCMSAYGHGVYLSSPSEIQKFTIANEFYTQLDELLGQLFIEIEMPERPKEGFLAGLFGVGGRVNADREELFGEAGGRPQKSVAKLIPGSGVNTTSQEHMQMRAGTVAGEVAKTRMMMVERGQKLGELGDRTDRMMNESENFSNAAHQLMLKYKDKKWYQL